MLSVTGVRVNLIKEIGEISEKKITSLKDKIGDSFPQIVTLPVGNVFVNPDLKLHVLIANSQITLAQDGVDINPDFDYLKKLLEDVFQALLLEDSANVSFNFTGVIDQENSMTKSIGIADGGKIELIEGIEGLGLRFFYNYQFMKGDYKVEPLIQDHNKWFFQLEVSSQPVENKLSLDQVIQTGIDLYEKFTGELADFGVRLVNNL